jgi:hypothetical protein
MGIRDGFRTQHERDKLRSRVRGLFGTARRRLLAAGALSVAAASCVSWVYAPSLVASLSRGLAGEGDVEQGPEFEASFLQGITNACNGVNRSNRQTVRLNAALQKALDRSHTRNQVTKAVLTSLRTHANAGTDTADLLASVSPPPMGRIGYDEGVEALKRNVARLHRVISRLEEADTPGQVRTVMRRAREQEQQSVADRATIRATLMALGGSHCSLEPTPTLHPVFPPAFYAGNPQHPGKLDGRPPAAIQSAEQVPDQPVQTVVPLPRGGSGPPSGGSWTGIVETLSTALLQATRISISVGCAIPI